MPDFNADVDFSFIADQTLRDLLTEYHKHAVTACGVGAYLGTLVACGGVLEGVLAWTLVARGMNTAGKQPIERANLSDLIDCAVKQRIVGSLAAQSAMAVKDFRNILHPYKVLRSQMSTRPNQALAANSLTAVQEIVRSVSARLRNLPDSTYSDPRTLDLPFEAKRLNFSWLHSNTLAGCAGPNSDRDLLALYCLGVRVLVRLAKESVVTPERVGGAGLTDFFEPVQDYEAPTQNQIDNVVACVRDAIGHERPVALSCGAGYGRTGTLLACVLVAQGSSAEDAIQVVVEHGRKPETPDQFQAIRDYAHRRVVTK